MSVSKKPEGAFDGYRTQELRDMAMLHAALNKDPSMFGEMDEAQKAEYESLVKEIESLPPGATIDVPYNMD